MLLLEVKFHYSFLYATMLLHFTSIDIAEMMELKELKEKAEEEARILLKIIEHITQQENNQTAVSLDYFYLLILYLFSPGWFPEGGEGCYAKWEKKWFCSFLTYNLY